MQEKNNIYKSYRNSKNNNNIQYLRILKQVDLPNATEPSKLDYHFRITYKLINIPKIQKFIGHY